MADTEDRACFYLGREYDLATRKVLDRTVNYEASDLTTHGVVVGMTGSGKITSSMLGCALKGDFTIPTNGVTT